MGGTFLVYISSNQVSEPDKTLDYHQTRNLDVNDRVVLRMQKCNFYNKKKQQDRIRVGSIRFYAALTKKILQ